MSSGFVAAGSGDDGSAPNNPSSNNTTNTQQDSAWAEAQRKIDATRQHSSLAGSKPRLGEQEGGKSLYETLQANKGEFYSQSSFLALTFSLVLRSHHTLDRVGRPLVSISFSFHFYFFFFSLLSS